jgi:hypothetical protein
MVLSTILLLGSFVAATVDPGRINDPTILAQTDSLFKLLSDKRELEEAAMAVWQQYTTGTQRSLSHYVNSVKSNESRINRALELTENMKAGRYPLPKRKS